MTDRVFRTAGDWALVSDGVQWILQRRYAESWRNVSFVRSTNKGHPRQMHARKGCRCV
jgi:hypothetical protein